MTESEFGDLGTYLAKLWPKFSLTEEQRQVWLQKLRFIDIFTARQAAGDAYAADLWATPKLAELIAAIKNLKRGGAGKVDVDFSAEFLAQVEREEAEEAAIIADWTPTEIENGKAEIIRNEPGMTLISDLPGAGKLWRHFLVERYAHERAMIFPGNMTVTQEGRVRKFHLPVAIPVNRDAYWAGERK